MISFLNLVTSGASYIVYFISILIESRALNRVRYYNRLHLISKTGIQRTLRDLLNQRGSGLFKKFFILVLSVLLSRVSPSEDIG
jgi:hypothetical protein